MSLALITNRREELMSTVGRNVSCQLRDPVDGATSPSRDRLKIQFSYVHAEHE